MDFDEDAKRMGLPAVSLEEGLNGIHEALWQQHKLCDSSMGMYTWTLATLSSTYCSLQKSMQSYGCPWVAICGHSAVCQSSQSASDVILENQQCSFPFTHFGRKQELEGKKLEKVRTEDKVPFIPVLFIHSTNARFYGGDTETTAVADLKFLRYRRGINKSI
ncbi:hypothetical protein Cadr_000004471 [Camelus dromedarius]|uniref:Uncharacterized protein n=1 Tax=Camelus dromedarius TaxID=9838 RepID=A0A5N4EC09_CAMDR|nr:hypothetical protein Cadr_000004471 [Camelus dromedarius]